MKRALLLKQISINSILFDSIASCVVIVKVVFFLFKYKPEVLEIQFVGYQLRTKTLWNNNICLFEMNNMLLKARFVLRIDVIEGNQNIQKKHNESLGLREKGLFY